MTIAQQLELEGWKEGWRQGWKEGWQQGLQEASLKIACNLLKSGMDSQRVRQMTGLTEEELKQAQQQLQ